MAPLGRISILVLVFATTTDLGKRPVIVGSFFPTGRQHGW